MIETRAQRLGNVIERLAPPIFMIPATFVTMVAELYPLAVRDWLFIAALECAVVLSLLRRNRLPRVLLAYCIVMGIAWAVIWLRPWTVGDVVGVVVCALFLYALLAIGRVTSDDEGPPPAWTLPRWSVPAGRAIFERGVLRVEQREFQPLFYVFLVGWFASVLLIDWLLP